MKLSFIVPLLVSLMVVGCEKKEELPSAPVAAKENVATAPVDYLSRAAQAGQAMEKKLDTVSLNSAVELFNAQEGRLQKDLNELVEKKYLGKLPTPPFGMKLQYDAATGKVTVVKE